MKIKVFQPLVIIDILTAVLLLVILFVPVGFLRLVLGLPFILFFPGYALVSALFSNRRENDILEILALSVIASIAIVGLIGLGLNFTPFGIAEVPAVCSIAAFIMLISIWGLIRQSQLPAFRLVREFNIKLSMPRLNLFSKSLTSFLLVAIIIATGVLGYTVFASKDREQYSEFYILGLNGKAHNYPLEFIMENNRIVRVNYDVDIDSTTAEWGKVTVGIVNHQQQRVSYSVKINVDDEAVDMSYAGRVLQEIKPIELSPGGRWEGDVGFAPRQTGNNQKVEFLLFQGNTAVPEDTLQLWIKTIAE